MQVDQMRLDLYEIAKRSKASFAVQPTHPSYSQSKTDQNGLANDFDTSDEANSDAVKPEEGGTASVNEDSRSAYIKQHTRIRQGRQYMARCCAAMVEGEKEQSKEEKKAAQEASTRIIESVLAVMRV